MELRDRRRSPSKFGTRRGRGLFRRCDRTRSISVRSPLAARCVWSSIHADPGFARGADRAAISAGCAAVWVLPCRDRCKPLRATTPRISLRNKPGETNWRMKVPAAHAEEDRQRRRRGHQDIAPAEQSPSTKRDRHQADGNGQEHRRILHEPIPLDAERNQIDEDEGPGRAARPPSNPPMTPTTGLATGSTALDTIRRGDSSISTAIETRAMPTTGFNAAGSIVASKRTPMKTPTINPQRIGAARSTTSARSPWRAWGAFW